MNVSQSLKMSFSNSLTTLKTRRDWLYVLVFGLALVAFEAFNYSTTEFALADLLGDLHFAGIRWATLLAFAFCGIDFAGIARLFMPLAEKDDSYTMWFMFGAWILAATMNAILTWWGVVIAMQIHPILSAGVVDASFVTRVMPVFIALLVWVIRILLVAALSQKRAQVFDENAKSGTPAMSRREYRQAQSHAAHTAQALQAAPASAVKAGRSKAVPGSQGFRPTPKYMPLQEEARFSPLKASGVGHRRA